MLTYQDFLAEPDKAALLPRLIGEHTASAAYQTALLANQYDAQKNATINEFVHKLYTKDGRSVVNFVASNNKIASNFFRRLNTQRCTYSLGNGITFAKDDTRARLDQTFDTRIKEAGYLALIHGVSYVFQNNGRLHVFPMTEFVPIVDEETSALRAGLRYWQIESGKPMFAVLYEEDGYTRYRTRREGAGHVFEQAGDKQPYLQIVATTEADGDVVVGRGNYGALPIVPLYGSRLHQSTLVGMQQAIDGYDLIRSGFANDLQDCAQIYWLLENYGGMDQDDLQEFLENILLRHAAVVDTQQGGKVSAHTQEIPHEARGAFLDRIRAGIYEDFGALDVSSISASSKTATEINAAYQPLDENADDFEYQLIECIQRLLALIGVEDTPTFKRNRVSNQLEQVQMVAMEAEWLDDETILSLLPNISADEIPGILRKREAEGQSRFAREQDTIDGVEGAEE